MIVRSVKTWLFLVATLPVPGISGVKLVTGDGDAAAAAAAPTNINNINNNNINSNNPLTTNLQRVLNNDNASTNGLVKKSSNSNSNSKGKNDCCAEPPNIPADAVAHQAREQNGNNVNQNKNQLDGSGSASGAGTAGGNSNAGGNSGNEISNAGGGMGSGGGGGAVFGGGFAGMNSGKPAKPTQGGGGGGMALGGSGLSWLNTDTIKGEEVITTPLTSLVITATGEAELSNLGVLLNDTTTEGYGAEVVVDDFSVNGGGGGCPYTEGLDEMDSEKLEHMGEEECMGRMKGPGDDLGMWDDPNDYVAGPVAAMVGGGAKAEPFIDHEETESFVDFEEFGDELPVDAETPSRRKLRGAANAEDDAESDAGNVERSLQSVNLGPAVATWEIGEFHPLDCNANLTTAPCDGSDSTHRMTHLVSQTSADAPIVVPCGVCVLYDMPSKDTIVIGGLDIIGKLYIPTNHKATIKTPFVFVQGELEMSDTNDISRDNESVKIVLTSSMTQTLTPTSGMPLTLTPADSNAHVGSFDAGIKAFVVAGGKLNIRGWDGTDGENEVVSTWTPLLAMAEGDRPRPTLSNVPGENANQERTMIDVPTRLVPAVGDAEPCPRQLVDYTYNQTLEGDGLITNYNNNGLLLYNAEQYHMPDMVHITQECPLVDGANYLLTIRLMISKEVDGVALTGKMSHWPYLRRTIMRHDANDLHEDRHMRKGIVGEYGEWFTFSSVWHWKSSDQELGPNVISDMFHIRNISPGSTVHLDFFTFELGSQKSYAPADDACYELAVNGDAEDTDGRGQHYYPFYSSDYYAFEPVVMEEIVTDADGNEVTNKYWQNRNRRNHYHSQRFYLNPACLVMGDKYAVSQRLRIVSGSAFSYYINLVGYDPTNNNKGHSKNVLDCPHQTAEDGWVTCEGPKWTIDDLWARLENIRWEVITSDRDHTNWAVIDLDDISIQFSNGAVKGLKVDKDATPRWAANSEVHITSSTLNWLDSQEAVISSVDKDLADSNTLVLESGIDAPLSEADTPGMGVEIALLTRNIKIVGENTEAEGTECKPPSCTGGYLQVLHTPGVAQIIEGVEFDNMGQQQGLNRFPLQFLYTKDVPNSIIARNSIRRSHHRCISMDGVSNVTISANVAHDTAGHCYYFGYEASDNLIVNNIGSKTNSDIHRHNDLEGFDDGYYRATFNIENTQNDFIGNVAAGSVGYGWFADLHWRTRGENNKDNQFTILKLENPRRKYMGVFRGNKAHSNHEWGFRFYHFEQFYNQRHATDFNPLFEDLYAYRNRVYGVYAYNMNSPVFRGGVLSDNQWGMIIRVADGVVLSDFSITGSSELFKDYTITRSSKLCPHTSWDHQGIHMMSKISRYGHTDPGKGLTMTNVTFDGFDKEKTWYPNCRSTTAIAFAGDKHDGHFDYISRFENVNINDSRNLIIDGCRAATSPGVHDIVFHDVDGSWNSRGDSTSGTSGFLVSDNSFMTDIFEAGVCDKVNHCMSYCANTCLRTFSYRVEQFQTQDWKLKITDVSTSRVMFVPSTIRTSDDQYFPHAYEGRRFSASLPEGNYTAEFVDATNATVWPKYVEETWNKEPTCSGFVTMDMVKLVIPDLQEGACDELVANRGQGLINTTEPWIHTFYDWEDAALLVGKNRGKNNSDAIMTTNRRYHWLGIGQNVDSRCLSRYGGDYYEFTAWMKVTPNEITKPTVPIDPNKGGNDFPRMTFNKRWYRDTATKEYQATSDIYDLAVMARPYVENDWSLIHGITRLPKTHRAFWELERTPDWYNLIVDDVSFTPMACSNDELALNGDLEKGGGLSKYWDTWGSAVELAMVPGYGGVGHALKAQKRPHYSHGPAQLINTDCLVENDRVAVSARIKFEDSENPAQQSKCNPHTWNNAERCSDILVYTQKDGVREYTRVAEVSTSTPDNDGWQHVHGILTLGPNKAKADTTKIYFDGRDAKYDVTVDDLSLKHVPFQCNDLVLNPSFTEGAAYWALTGRENWRADIVPGAGGAGNAMRIYERDHRWRGIRQKLDSRCFDHGNKFTISAKFQLFNATGHGFTCATNTNHDNHENCPTVAIYGFSCEGPNRNVYSRYWNALQDFDWDPNSFNDFGASFEVTSVPYLATCNEHWVYVHQVHHILDLVVDELQISAFQEAVPTTSPTAAATTAVTERTNSPSSSPTTMPTTSAITLLPLLELTPTEISSGPHMLARSTTLCVLTKAVPVDGALTSIAPVALSYDGGDWEKAAGDFATALLRGVDFGDYSDGSHITLPELAQNERYYLTSYSHQVTPTDKVARLLETATFGTKAEDLSSWTKGEVTTATATEWIQEQMDLPMTSHREFFRHRTNPRAEHPVGIARTGHPCSPQSRWRNFAFTRKHGDLRWNPQEFKAVHREGDAYVEIRLNGHIRTVVRNDTLAFRDNSNYNFEYNRDYLMCSSPEAYADGRFWLRVNETSRECEELRNPLVHFYADSPNPMNVLRLPAISRGVLEQIDEARTRGGEYILFGALTDDVCNQLNDVTEERDPPVFGQLPDGSWLQFDPRLMLEENIVDDPIADGGGLVRSLTGEQTKCANVPRTFLNQDSCSLSNSSLACGSAGTPNLMIDLDAPNIVRFHDITGQYVYAVLGLPLTDVDNVTQPSPCDPGLRSRWEIIDVDDPDYDCNPTAMGPLTNASLVALLLQREGSDTNNYLRDIFFPISGDDFTCDAVDVSGLVDADIIIGEKCFRRVHPDHLSVYDFTWWTQNTTHPGNMVAQMAGNDHPIKKWMDGDDDVFLHFPAEAPADHATLASHPIGRWDTYSPMFSKLGRFGDQVKFVDLPNEIRLDEVAQEFGAETEVGGGGIVVCGSPNEAANNLTLGQVFEVTTGRDTAWGLDRQREYAWMQIALTANDQLRQRVAWALAQLLVIAQGAIGVQGSHTEVFMGYYDIFVRHAFGNYRDVLREISYSPLMAENLSFLQSKSAAYTWEYQQKISFADENFAREIMQLFSTGLVKLNLDGTPKVDSNGHPLLAYTNDEIMSFARIWTGFDYQQGRGNVEETSWSGNRHDPMKIQAGWRDKFPKTDMTSGYIGDGFPLCVDLPEKMFLRKGAEYRLLGASHMPELMEDDASFKNDPILKKFVLDSGSDLKSILCSEDANNRCQYENTVTLPTSLNCTAAECDADALRVVQVNDVHYEYVRPPCVEQTFYANAKKVIWRHREYDSSCANPLLPYASEACCEGQHDTRAERFPHYLYDQERVKFSTAGQRCQLMVPPQVTCDFTDIEGIDHSKKGYHWTTDSCSIQVKVNDVGQVALVYDPESYNLLHPHVRADNRNFFKVYWDGDYPKNNATVSVGNMCGNNTCESLATGGCLCGTTISESRVFKEMPRNVDEVMSKLTIGFHDTTAFDEGTYADSIVVNGVTAYLTASSGAFDTKTVFEVTDEYGRLHRFKNTYERVRIQGAPEYAFRNAPSFMSVLNSEADARDAYYETEAALDHYFYHDNTAPFIAFRLIQRFTTSNPRPRYVKAVATAFRTGIYEGIGSSKYGDLGATIAAVLLDPEARSVNLDADPFKGNLREPMLRMTALMRGMELKQTEGQPLVRLVDLDTKIGQQAHSFPTVFSFMLPEYAPGGRPGDATLVGPETMIMDMPKVVSLLNGMYSLVKYGLSRCYGGFGTDHSSCNEGDFSRSTAHLSFSRPYVAPEAAHHSLELLNAQAEIVVSELATLLTSGRLGSENKELIKEAYISKLNDTSIDDPSGSALRIAQQLVLITPEFHTTNVVSKTGTVRAQPDPLEASGIPYKAIVYVMFGGGCDSFNMLVPHTCTGEKDMWQEYADIRQDIALTKDDTLNVLNDVTNQVCTKFAVHPQLGSVQQMFNNNDLLFFANTGVLTKETDKENYWRDTETQLFAHNWMQQAAQRIDPLKAEDGTGILGRIRDVLTDQGLSVGAFSLDVNSISLIGTPGVTASPMILSNNGIAPFNQAASIDGMNVTIAALNGETKTESGVFSEWYSDTLMRSLSHNDLLYDTLLEKTTDTTFPTSHLGRQLSMVAKMIDSRSERGTDADVFYLSTGGWDTHSMLLDNHVRLFGAVDAAFNAFAEEMKVKEVWDSVTLIQTSDFARTLTQNGGKGSDHAWGGNYIMMGGSVNGGQIAGEYPHDIAEGRAPLNIGRGRIIPTTSWEAVFLPLAEWAGVNETAFDYVCPNRGNFPVSHFFNMTDLFEA